MKFDWSWIYWYAFIALVIAFLLAWLLIK